MEVFPITIKIYAESEAEAQEAQQAIRRFIVKHAQENRAVSAKKIVSALSRWDANAFVKNQIIRFLQ